MLSLCVLSLTYPGPQELDFFGEIAGLAFTPDASTLFVGVSDLTYASLMHFERQRCAW